MKENRILKKMLAILLIFTLTSANFLFVGQSFAAGFGDIFSSATTTNVEFDAYFRTETDERPVSVISDVNNKDQAINLSLSVKDSGYLKDAKIKIEGEEGKELNFVLGELSEENTMIQSMEDNEIILKQIDSNVEANIILPISYKYEKYVNDSNISSRAIATLTGIYVNSDGEDVEVSYEESLNVSWVDARTATVSSSLEKFIDYGDGIILQTSIKIDGTTEENTLPIRETNVNIEVPVLNNQTPSNVMVVANRTENTNGQNPENIAFGDSNWKYEGDHVSIHVSNEKKMVTFNEFEDEYLIDQEKLIQEERYYNQSGVDEFVVTYVYEGLKADEINLATIESLVGSKKILSSSDEIDLTMEEVEDIELISTPAPEEAVENNGNDIELTMSDEVVPVAPVSEEKKAEEVETTTPNEPVVQEEAEPQEEPESVPENMTGKILSNVKAEIITYSNSEDSENSNVTTINNSFVYDLNEQVGNLVSLDINNETNEVSKANMYSNYINEEKHETEFVSREILNITNKDIIESLTIKDVSSKYISKDGREIETGDMYTKNISIQAENFKSILGDEGYVRIYDRNGVMVAELKGDVYSYDFATPDSFAQIETSKPVSEGNLVITVTRAIANSNISKAELENVAEFKNTIEATAKYQYVENATNLGTAEIVTKLNDTKSKINLVMSKDSLSTLSVNEDVEIKLELNNNNEWSDMYGNSRFTIDLPENVESVEIKDANIVYGEGLELANAEVVEGNKIMVTLSGHQNGQNSSVLTNGTNVLIDADIKVSEFTPIVTEDVNVSFENDEATNYDSEGSSFDITYSAPKGMVSVNSISGYKEGAMVTSIAQGSKSDYIDVHSDAKAAEMDLYIMNNTDSNVSNIKILGRFPYANMVDMVTNSTLGSGTTVDTRLLTGITSNNEENFNVYYSNIESATADIEDVSNGWYEGAGDISNAKSFLIVPEDNNFELQPAGTLDFKYNFEIPADLAHDETVAGTYITYYTSNESESNMDLMSFPDVVELTTGNGPELDVDVNFAKDTVREYEQFPISINVRNVGKEKAEDIDVRIPVPVGASYVDNVVTGEDVEANVTVENNELRVTAPSVDINREMTIKMNVKASEIGGEEAGKIEAEAKVDAKNLGTTLSDTGSTKVENAEFRIEDEAYNHRSESDRYQNVGDEIVRIISVENLTNKTIKNVVVTKQLSESVECTYADANRILLTENVPLDDGTWDKDQIKWTFDEMTPGETIFMKYKLKVVKVENNLTNKVTQLAATIKGDGTEEYSSIVDMKVSAIDFEINQTTDRDVNNKILDDEKITYFFTIKNNGEQVARNAEFSDEIPDVLEVDEYELSYSDKTSKNTQVKNNKLSISIPVIESKAEATIKIVCTPRIQTEAYEVSATNYATIGTSQENIKESNKITHIIKVDKIDENEAPSEEEVQEDVSTPTSTNQPTENSENTINRTYKVSGYVWDDANKNGIRESDEKAITAVQVKLIESETGIIKNTVTPNGSGLYEFSGVEKGKYVVLYDYDTIKYGITTYHKDGVATNVNSDAVQTKITQDGKIRNAAVSDKVVVENASVSNIDIGLFEADKFDMSIEMGISKVTIQNSSGTTTHEYSGDKLVKEDIAAKSLNGSTVHVEYDIKVTNSGDLAGYVKKIIDYKPQDMEFNSSMNSDWYSTSDGTLYTTKFENHELAKGETVTLKLVLTKNMTENNTGLVNNQVEIYEDYNIYGVSDYNSSPGNKAQGENDLSSSDIIVLIKTGETLIYTSVLITTFMITGLAIVVVSRKIVQFKKKGGV